MRYTGLEFSHSTSADRPHENERHNRSLGSYLGASTEGCVDIHARVKPNSKPHSCRGQQMRAPHLPQHIYQPGRRRQGAGRAGRRAECQVQPLAHTRDMRRVMPE